MHRLYAAERIFACIYFLHGEDDMRWDGIKMEILLWFGKVVWYICSAGGGRADDVLWRILTWLWKCKVVER
jgi:hypothetical protein